MKANADAHLHEHSLAVSQWKPVAEGAYNAATNGAAKVNGTNKKGLASQIKPEAQRLWSEAFATLGPAREAFQEFGVPRDPQQANPRTLQRAAEKVVARSNAAKALFDRGNAAQG